MDDLAAARWFKSSHSGASENCVEVAFLADSLVGVRDSKHSAGPALIFTGGEWSAFTASAARGDLDF
ncbi:DUF397 domain-containing protein [Nocardia sp. MDA0666]|uniref:DUF397 domain-containing protein n=1 Tax=Nocardia sp. MDA0666 TaxID=2135448 RepID=UPI000D12E771|nr:DUF397 domain-containing protein [Nocardia sp. MDA0666]PSR67250.1 DUF397 domain-containing protein [Nocardia sp. MDA0666]